MTPAPPTAPSVDWSSYAWPRTYRAGGFGAVLVYLMAAAFILGGGAALVFLTRLGLPTPLARAVMATIAAVFVAIGVAMIADSRRSRLTLSREGIELVELFRQRSLRRDAIAGYVAWTHQGITTLRLMPSNPTQKPLDIALFGIATDEAFLPWFLSLTDLVGVQREAARDEALADPALGADVATRSVRLDRAVRIAKGLNGVAFVVSAWAWLYPAPYLPLLALCALLPVAALALHGAAPAMFSVNESPQGARGSLMALFLAPSAALALRAGFDVPLVAWTTALAPTAVALAALVLAHHLVSRDRKLPLSEQLLFALLGSMWAFGAVVHANALLDRGTPWAFTRVEVLRKRESHGKTTTYTLTVGPWGPRRDRNDLHVPAGLYREVEVGGAVCVGLRPGGLRMPWYWVGRAPCPRATAAR